MTAKPCAHSRAIALALGSALLGLFSSAANAASVSYGSFVAPPGVMFSDVTESSPTDPVPLYGPPVPFATGLDFDPQSFAAFNATGSSGGGDVTDGQLNFGVMNSVGISSISLTEAGDYSLVGVGTAATSVFAGGSLRVKVTHIDGVDVPDIFIPQSNASVSFNLLANPGVLQPWQLNTTVGIGAFLTANGVPFNSGATKIEVVIDNQLLDLSQPGTAAVIVKKEFAIDVEPRIPEPTTLALAGLALCGLGMQSRRRR